MAGAGALFEKPIEPIGLLERIAELLAEPPERRLERLCGRVEDTKYVRAERGRARVPQSALVAPGGDERVGAEAKGAQQGRRS
jgi:hypothetical protein